MGKEVGYEMRLLDLGGGWQGTDFETPTLKDVAAVLVPELQIFKREFPDLDVIAEPGRYFALRSHTLVCNIFARRVVRDASGKPERFVYYISDGVYQSFNCIFFDHQHPTPLVLHRSAEEEVTAQQAQLYSTMIFGPTCDSLDCITKDAQLPELQVGDWLYFENMGAYTSAAQSPFNGFSGATTCHYVWGPKFMDSFMDVFTELELAEAYEPDKINAESPANAVASASAAAVTETTSPAELVPVVAGC